MKSTPKLKLKKRPKFPILYVPFDLVWVEWEDSQQPVSTWQWVDEYELPVVIGCISVGYLIAETPDAIAIAPNLGDTTRDRIQASGIMRIPVSAVRQIVRLQSRT